MIRRIGKWTVFIGKIPVFRVIPSFTYLNGGCYKKIGLTFFNILIEFSRPKKIDKKTKNEYLVISSEELSKVIEDYKSKFNKTYRDTYYD